jgi:hypothetical protein
MPPSPFKTFRTVKLRTLKSKQKDQFWMLFEPAVHINTHLPNWNHTFVSADDFKRSFSFWDLTLASQ